MAREWVESCIFLTHGYVFNLGQNRSIPEEEEKALRSQLRLSFRAIKH
jgi:hypothetical protein